MLNNKIHKETTVKWSNFKKITLLHAKDIQGKTNMKGIQV